MNKLLQFSRNYGIIKNVSEVLVMTVTQSVKIGRSTIPLSKIKRAVEESRSPRQVTGAIGLCQGLPKTVEQVREIIEQQGYDTSHFRKTYDKTNRGTREKPLDIKPVNKKYFESFLKTVSLDSRTTYRSAFGGFLVKLGRKDLMTVSEDDIKEYSSNWKSAYNYIRGALIFVLRNDIDGAKKKAEKNIDLVISLIGK
jgi:hypothetical protein